MLASILLVGFGELVRALLHIRFIQQFLIVFQLLANTFVQGDTLTKWRDWAVHLIIISQDTENLENNLFSPNNHLFSRKFQKDGIF